MGILTSKTRLIVIPALAILVLAACSPQAAEAPDDTAADAEVIQAELTDTPSPTETVAPTPTETIAPSPTVTFTPGPTPTFAPIFDVGVIADLGTTDDIIGIEGVFEIVSMTEIKVTGMLFTVLEAPGVDIRLGVDRDFSDEVAVSLKDITGIRYNYRDFTITIPSEAFDGRSFNSIGIYCYDTDDLFDFAVFETPIN